MDAHDWQTRGDRSPRTRACGPPRSRADHPGARGDRSREIRERRIAPAFLRYDLKYDDRFPGAHHVGGMVSARAPGVPETTPGITASGTNKFEGTAMS